jgi:hypothetical protein
MSVVVPLMAPVFKLESTAHNLNTQYRKRMRQLAKLTESIDALQQMVDDSAHIRPSFSYESDVDRIEGLQKAARRRLGLQ